jgi:hypothetical protein
MEDKKITAVGEPEAAAEVNNIKDIIAQAKEKINSKDKPEKNDMFAAAIGEHIKKALVLFCEQNEEFARAVLDGGSANECIKSVADKIRTRKSVSDFDVYQLAVKYYFPVAVVDFVMKIRMSEYEQPEQTEQTEQTEAKTEQTEVKAEQTEQKTALDLSLDSLLDW